MGMDSQAASDEAQFSSGYDDKPTETPAAVKTEEKQEPASTTPAPEPVDPLKEVIARLDKFQASHDTLAGNLGRLQQSQREMQSNLAAAQAATKTVSEAPTQAQVKEAAANPAEWEALKKDWPDWADAIEKFHESRMPAFDAAAFEASIMQKMEGQTAAMQEKIIHASLNAVSPGWVATINSDEYKAWFATQKPEIQALMQSDDVGDAARMLKMYDAHRNAPPPPKPAPKPDTSSREKRIAAAVTPRGAGGHAAGSSEMDDFESGYSS